MEKKKLFENRYFAFKFQSWIIPTEQPWEIRCEIDFIRIRVLSHKFTKPKKQNLLLSH